MFLSRLKEELQIPVLGLVDSDPYGLKILSVYMSGSKNMSYDSASLTTPDIKWLGLRPSDLNRYNLPDQCRLNMTENDIKTGKELLQEDFIQKNPKWMKELEIMVSLDRLRLFLCYSYLTSLRIDHFVVILCVHSIGENKEESRNSGSVIFWIPVYYKRISSTKAKRRRLDLK